MPVLRLSAVLGSGLVFSTDDLHHARRLFFPTCSSYTLLYLLEFLASPRIYWLAAVNCTIGPVYGGPCQAILSSLLYRPCHSRFAARRGSRASPVDEDRIESPTTAAIVDEYSARIALEDPRLPGQRRSCNRFRLSRPYLHSHWKRNSLLPATATIEVPLHRICLASDSRCQQKAVR